MLEGSVVCMPTPFFPTSGTVDKLLNHTVSVFSPVKWEQHTYRLVIQIKEVNQRAKALFLGQSELPINDNCHHQCK